MQTSAGSQGASSERSCRPPLSTRLLWYRQAVLCCCCLHSSPISCQCCLRLLSTAWANISLATAALGHTACHLDFCPTYLPGLPLPGLTSYNLKGNHSSESFALWFPCFTRLPSWLRFLITSAASYSALQQLPSFLPSNVRRTSTTSPLHSV